MLPPFLRDARDAGDDYLMLPYIGPFRGPRLLHRSAHRRYHGSKQEVAGNTVPALELLQRDVLIAHYMLVEIVRRLAEDVLRAEAGSLHNPEMSLHSDTQLVVVDMIGTVESLVEMPGTFGEALSPQRSG